MMVERLVKLLTRVNHFVAIASLRFRVDVSHHYVAFTIYLTLILCIL